jgi:hypothetical protein
MISFRDDLKTAQLAFLSKYDDLAVKEMNEGNRQYSNSYIFNSYAVLVSKVRHKVYLRTVYRNRLSPGKKEFTSENWSGLRTECAENEISRIYLFIR